MTLWVILFAAWMTWMRFGAGGLEAAAVLGAMVLAGLGVRSFLNTFWRRKDRGDAMLPKMSFWAHSSNAKYQRGLFREREEQSQRDSR